MSIIAKLSFWILQSPKKEESIITELSFEDSVQGGLDQFRREGHVKKLKTSITRESLHSNKDNLPEFLSNQIVYT